MPAGAAGDGRRDASGLIGAARRAEAVTAGRLVRQALPNGLVVLVRESWSAPVVAMTLLAGCGAADEPADLNGVTTLLGRVLLKGTASRTALDVARVAEEAGGGIESATDEEFAELRAWGLARHWRRLLSLLHDVVTAARLDEAEIERERRVLLAQIQGLQDRPAHVANRLLARALFGPRGYGLPPSGEAATVARIGRADLVARLARVYAAGRLVLAVSGAVSADEVVAEAELLLGPLPPGGPAPEAPPSPPRPVRPRAREVAPTQQAHLLWGFLAPPVAAADHVPLKVLNGILGGGMSGRLFRTLRDAEGLAYSVGSAYPTRRGAGRLVIHIGTAPGNVPAAEAGIRREVERLAGEPVPREELARAIAYLTGAFLLDRRTNARQSFYLAFYEAMGVGAGYVTRYPSLVEAVTVEDVLRVARRHLVDPAGVVVGPA